MGGPGSHFSSQQLQGLRDSEIPLKPGHFRWNRVVVLLSLRQQLPVHHVHCLSPSLVLFLSRPLPRCLPESQFIVGEDGSCGVLYEQAVAEGPPIATIIDHVLDYW